MQRIIGAERAELDAAAGRRIRIDEVRRPGIDAVPGLAMHREAVADMHLGRTLGPQDRRRADPQGRAACQDAAPSDGHGLCSSLRVPPLYNATELDRTMAATARHLDLITPDRPAEGPV